MSSQQIADVTTITAVVQAATSVIQILIALIAIIIARRELRKWRIELLGSKKIDLAIKLGKAAIEVRDAFQAARNPVGFTKRDTEYPPNITHEEKNKLNQEYEYMRRLQPLQEKLSQLYDIGWEISILFGENNNIDKQIQICTAKFYDIQAAWWVTLEGGRTMKETMIMYGDPAGDVFSNEIKAATNELLEFARKYTL